jgi:hypothetical protein
MPEYLLELYAGTTDVQLPQYTGDVSAAAERLTRQGTRVRYRRSILVPAEQTCFVLVEADSLDDVLDTLRAVDLVCDRVSPALSHPRYADVEAER